MTGRALVEHCPGFGARSWSPPSVVRSGTQSSRRLSNQWRGINPFDYLMGVLGRVQDHPANAIDALLPAAWATAI